MKFDRFLTGLALVVLASLNGCGGGGGGSTDLPQPPVAPAPPVVLTSGLVPEAGPTGATLYADAAALRVLRDGAVWTYRGIDQPRGAESGPDEIRTYANTVKHTSSSDGMLENGSNVFNDGPETGGPVRLEGGAYRYSVSIGLAANAAPLPVDVVELRSPVKVGEQFAHLDKHIANAGVDLDEDKVNDGFDVAMYTRVVGEETLDLRNRPQVKAVRVDTILRARAIFSKTGDKSPMFEIVQSNWYAPGLGVVKRRVEEPNSTPGAPNRIVTETLQNWDGGTEGLGHTDVVAAVAPASALVGMMLQYPLAAVGLDTHAVVATLLPMWHASADGLALAQLDPRGNVLAVRAYARAELFPAAQYLQLPRLLRIGDEVRLLARTSAGVVSMVAFDATGQRILRPAVTVLSDPQLDDRNLYHVANDGAGFWLGWLRAVPDASGVDLRSALAQQFDANAQALGPARVVLGPVNAHIDSFSMASSDTRIAASWNQVGAVSGRRLAVMDTGSGALLADTPLAIAHGECAGVGVVALRPGIAMACWNEARAKVGVARIDASGQMVLSAGATLPTDTLKVDWLGTVEGGAQVTGDAGRLIVSAWQRGKYWPEDTNESGFTSVYQTGATSGPLAASAPVLLAHVEDSPMRVMTTIRLGNRLLLVGRDQSGYLRSTSVWLRD